MRLEIDHFNEHVHVQSLQQLYYHYFQYNIQLKPSFRHSTQYIFCSIIFSGLRSICMKKNISFIAKCGRQIPPVIIIHRINLISNIFFRYSPTNIKVKCSFLLTGQLCLNFYLLFSKFLPRDPS